MATNPNGTATMADASSKLDTESRLCDGNHCCRPMQRSRTNTDTAGSSGGISRTRSRPRRHHEVGLYVTAASIVARIEPLHPAIRTSLP